MILDEAGLKFVKCHIRSTHRALHTSVTITETDDQRCTDVYHYVRAFLQRKWARLHVVFLSIKEDLFCNADRFSAYYLSTVKAPIFQYHNISLSNIGIWVLAEGVLRHIDRNDPVTSATRRKPLSPSEDL